jgi:drug/metabolite transporter (DMT)-like permease
MNIVFVLIIILSAFIHALWNFFAKQSKDKLTFLWLAKIFQALIYLPVIIILIRQSRIPAYGWYTIIGSGITHIFYWFFLAKAYSNEDLSLVYPISRSAPALVLIFAVIFLKERVSWAGIIGIGIVLIGVYIISTNSFHSGKIVKPLHKFSNKGIIFSLLTLLTVTVYSLIDKIGSKYVNPIIYVYLFDLISFVGLSPVILLGRERTNIKIEWHNNHSRIILTSIMVILSYSLAIFVMRTSPVSYVVSIREVGIVFGVLLGSLILKEKYGKVRLIASIIMLIGVLLITFAG